MNGKSNLKTSWFFKWLVDNKVATAFVVILLFLLNVWILSKLSFMFQPILAFFGIIMLPIILAAVFYYLLNPIVDYFDDRKVPRVVTISVLFALILALIVWGLAVAIPNLIGQGEKFVNNFPDYVETAQKHITNLLSDERFAQFKPQISKAINTFSDNLIDISKGLSSSVVDSTSSFLTTATSVLISIMIFPFILFYLLRDGKNLNRYVTNMLPTAWRNDTSIVLTQVNLQLSSYVRGQLIVAATVAIMFTIMFSIVGLKYAVIIGITAGFLNLIPYLGSFLAMIPAFVIALIAGPFMVVKVAIVFIIEQTIEGRFVSPLVLGSKLNIHPITILFVLLTSGKIFGFWGVLIGIPVYASIKVIIVYFYKWYRKISSLYEDDALGQADN
ncbi:MAG: AI-2E family transporter [Streptococcaceae bacterium]|nr:AI-2E family transporter [Streptococcaceae bacterium]